MTSPWAIAGDRAVETATSAHQQDQQAHDADPKHHRDHEGDDDVDAEGVVVPDGAAVAGVAGGKLWKEVKGNVFGMVKGNTIHKKCQRSKYFITMLHVNTFHNNVKGQNTS